MRPPSRRLPPRLERSAVRLWPWLAGAVVAAGYFLYSSSNRARCVTAAVVAFLVIWIAITARREKHRFAAIARARAGESICDFARSFDTRHTDTWVIRAAHQEVRLLLASCAPRFPLRASDELLADLHLDSDDVDDLIVDIAARAGRALADAESNPFYGKVVTVSDLVRFIDAQPRMAAGQPTP